MIDPETSGFKAIQCIFDFNEYLKYNGSVIKIVVI